MQLVLHAPFGSRINKAWGLALRKRFCRQFNFELQAAATEDALLLSLGPQHSFPLADVFRYLHPDDRARRAGAGAARRAGLPDALALEHDHLARRPAQSRRHARSRRSCSGCMADDLMAAVFPDAAACLENIPGDRQIPDHPLVAPDGSRLPRRGDGFRRARARCCTRIHARRAPAGRARHAGAVAVRARDPQRAPVRVPRRCAARGAADAGGAGAAGDAIRRRQAIWARSIRARSRACATKRAPIRATPTSCTTRCSRPDS